MIRVVQQESVDTTPLFDPSLRVLRDVFGFAEFRGRQRAAIDAALAGRDALVLMPTGGGKSLCYQIPALVRDGVGLVVSPLIALMEDQVSALRELGIKAAFLNSALDRTEQREVAAALRAGALKFLYVAPERLLREQTRALLEDVPLAIIAIDEAHCVSQWGHDFRQDYLALDRLAELFPGVPRMALTATATAPTRDEIIARLALRSPDVLIGDFDRPNIRYSVQPKASDVRRQLLQFLEGHRGNAGIVYCLTRKKTESTAAWLEQHGFTALPYHAGLPTGTRAEHQRRFLREDAVIIVATIAFGMGIDKPDVRFVAHVDLPKTLESYYQETGRAGRDGAPADAWMVYGLQDVVQQRQLIDGSAADEQRKRHDRHKLDALLGWCEVTDCRRRPLLAYFGVRRNADCGNCDNCLHPPTTWDATEAARKLLSAVYRSGQRFGAAHVVDILLGKQTAKVTQHGHTKLSVFGIGADLAAATWRSIVRQLVVRDHLRVDQSRFGALALTSRSRPLLRGEAVLQLREDRKPSGAKKSRRADAELGERDRPLWDALRRCRQRLAAEHDVPPYIIFHDATLMQMVVHRPTSRAELIGISGVGRAKLERYGDAFLDVIRATEQEPAGRSTDGTDATQREGDADYQTR
jgi:ATP-dependent DNA helicase RecQ